MGVLSVLLCFCMLCSCDNLNKANVEAAIGNKPIIAVLSDSDELLASEKFSEKIGGDIVRYNLTSDAVVAVLNGKADYVVLNEYESQEFIDAGNELELVECADYKIEYVAWFDADNLQLKNEFNKALKDLKNTGVIEKIKEANKQGGEYTYHNVTPSKGELVMICDPLFDNILYYSDSGEVCGTDYDIAKAVCNRLGYTLRIEVVDFDEIFNSLEAGEGDFVMSATQYSAERAEFFIASDVYSTLNFNVYKRAK